MTIIKDAEKLCEIINSEREFKKNIGKGKTIAFILQDNVDCCTDFVKNLTSDPDLKGILEMYEISAVYLDLENHTLGRIFQTEDVYCVPFVIAYEDGKRVNYLSSNIPANRFYDQLEKWYDL